MAAILPSHPGKRTYTTTTGSGVLGSGVRLDVLDLAGVTLDALDLGFSLSRNSGLSPNPSCSKVLSLGSADPTSRNLIEYD